MPRVLICASTLTHIHNFHLPYIRYFRRNGFEVHIAARGDRTPVFSERFHDVPFAKSMVSGQNLQALRRLCGILRENRFDLVLTHTALAGAVTRFALLLAGKRKTKVIHTVHGYLFWNGCGLRKRLTYRLPERLLRGVTDCVITMNEEDTETAQKLVKRGGTVRWVPGMGVDTTRFFPASFAMRSGIREKLSIPQNAFVIVYAAEFSARKNHSELIRALPALVRERPETLVLLCGTGELQGAVEEEAASLGLTPYIRLMGWHDDMDVIYQAADLSVSTSRSEGLPFNVIEAQLCGLPVAASRIRGHTDLIEHGVTGWMYPSGDAQALAALLTEIGRLPDCGRAIGVAAAGHAVRFSLEYAYAANVAVYKEILAH